MVGCLVLSSHSPTFGGISCASSASTEAMIEFRRVSGPKSQKTVFSSANDFCRNDRRAHDGRHDNRRNSHPAHVGMWKRDVGDRASVCRDRGRQCSPRSLCRASRTAACRRTTSSVGSAPRSSPSGASPPRASATEPGWSSPRRPGTRSLRGCSTGPRRTRLLRGEFVAHHMFLLVS